MRYGKVAILIMIAAAALRCSGNPPVSEPGQAVLNAPSAVVINAIDHQETPAGTEVVLHGNYPFSYTSYQPDPRTLVLELLDVHVDGLSQEVRIGTPQVEGVKVTSVESVDGGKIAKFEFKNVLAAQHSIRLEGHDLIVDFPSLGEGGNTPESPVVAESETGQTPLAEGATAENAPLASESGSGASQVPAEGAPIETLPATGASTEGTKDNKESAEAPATELKPLPEASPAQGRESASSKGTTAAASTSSSGVKVVRGAAPTGTRAKSLLSVEARGEDNEKTVVLTGDGGLQQEHFELKNPPRLVIDLVGVVDKTKTKTVAIGSGGLSRVRVAQFATKPKPVVRVVLDMSTPRQYAIVPTDNGIVVDFTEEGVRHALESQPQQVQPVASPLAAETPSGQPEKAGASASEGTATAASAGETSSEEPAAPAAEKAPVNPLVAEGGVKIESQGSSPQPATQQEVAFRPQDSGNVMISSGGKFSARAISDTGPKYTGKRISLNFKDADLKDVFRLFHEITGYNIVLDPAVAGTLTIVLENVPEDQALDIILKNNGLDKVFENNVIRIASSQKLAAEAAARKALIEAQQLEEEPVTFTRSLSYAKANDVMPIVKKIMSKRGDAIMDNRTNTLIITDLRDRQDPINRLIDALDEQTPQVVIEARIVETDREFERDLGVQWGATKNTTVHGTQTSFNYDVNLLPPAAAGTLGIVYGSVLDSFQLDVTLEAFELNGDVKVLSSPRIAAQNNQKAVIEQGVQIPVVSTTATQINVEFISASLKLEVLPQITKEGTVIMDVKVDNSSPDFVNRVGDVPPIITERAATQILVSDGGTAVIGGIFKLNDSVTQAGVPGLSKIPGLGWLFKNRSINRKNTELLIFITPRITKKMEPPPEPRAAKD